MYVAVMCPVLLFAFDFVSLFIKHSSTWMVELDIMFGDVLNVHSLAWPMSSHGGEQTFMLYFLVSH